MAKKFYAVRKGKKTGIFETWDDCKDAVSGYPGAEYKGFQTLAEARQFLGDDGASGEEFPQNYAFVDGSFNAATKVYGYGGFLVAGENRYELQGFGSDPSMASMRNVAGEVLGSTKAMEMALNLGLSELTIYYDYMGIEMWADGRWKRNKEGTIAYHSYVQSIRDRLTLHFVKVKGHSGVEGNEEADRLAKQAVGIE